MVQWLWKTTHVREVVRSNLVPICSTVQLVFILTRLDLTKQEKMFLLLCSEAVESKLTKLETSRTVIFPLTVSVLYSALKVDGPFNQPKV